MSEYQAVLENSSSAYQLTLRDYQNDGVQVIRQSFGQHRRVCYVLPTGGGKTVIFSYITYHAMQKQSRVVILAHRIEIVEQISKSLTNLGVDHGMILAGQKLDLTKRVQVGMVQTVANRLERLIEPALLVIDEAHHAVAGTWQKILNRWSSAYVLGVTATPERLDGRGLREVGFERLILGPDVAWLIQAKHLAAFKYLGASVNVDFDDVSTTAGDYDAQEVEARMATKSVTGDVIAHYRKHLEGRTCIAFCVTVRHAEMVASAYNDAGIPAASLDGSMHADDRARVIDDLRTGKIKVLTSCQVISEGFDAPSVGGCQLLRPTQSFAMFRQQIGRCLRPKEDGQPAIILDHVGNYMRHGLPDEPHEWDLDAKKKTAAERKQKKPTRLCKACGAVFPINAKGEPCPGVSDCIWVPKVPQQREGTLGEIVRQVPNPAWAGRLTLDRGNYRSLIIRAAGRRDRLEQIAQARGYKSGWVYHQVLEHAQKSGPIWGSFFGGGR